LKVGKQLLTCIPTNRPAEAQSLLVRVDFDDRTELLNAEPDLYYVTDHYLNYSAALVCFSHLTVDKLRDLPLMAHRFVNSRRVVPGIRPETREIDRTRLYANERLAASPDYQLHQFILILKWRFYNPGAEQTLHWPV
jgi:hypothetical protein